MDDGSIEFKEAAAAEVWATPIEALNPAQPDLFVADAIWPVFERLRKEAPVHWTPPNDIYDGLMLTRNWVRPCSTKVGA